MKIRSSILILAIFFLMIREGVAFQVAIQGVNKQMEENIRTNLSILKDPEEFKDDLNWFSEYQQQAQQEIMLALQPFGYYLAKVTSQLSDKNTLSFIIQLGPPTLVTHIQFQLIGEGEHDQRLTGLFNDFPLKAGEIFAHTKYEEGKKALLTHTIQSGYLNAAFTEHRVEINLDDNTCHIFLVLATGPKHYFGSIRFESTVLSPNFLNRYLSFQPNDIYSPEKTLALQSQLSQSDYFSSVNVKTLTEENSTIVPVVVELTDAKPNQYIIGGGYGTDTGLRGKVGWTRRQLNAYGHRFTTLVQIAEIYDKFEAAYTIPGKHPSTDQIKINGGAFREIYNEKTSQIYEAGITETRNFNEWDRILSLNYHHEQFNAFITNDKIEAKLVLPSITFIQTKRDDPINPTQGRRIEFTLKGSVDALISNTSFFQAYLQVKWLRVFNHSFKTLIRTELGFTTPDDDLATLPLSQRFFAGGDLSLRGYAYRSLPNEIDQYGNRHPVGGTYLAVGSIELDKTIKKPFGVFTFFDFGNAFRESGNQIAAGTGIGIEWQTRLGPLKFAVAKPLTKDAASWRIHATFGPEL